MLDYDGAVNALQKIISVKSVEEPPLPDAPFGAGVAECLELSLDMLGSSGFKTKNCDGFCGWGEIGEGGLFGILCHLDVVPEGGGWSVPPYSGKIVDGKLYGRGALDDKGPFIAALYAVKALLGEGLKPKKRLRFILGCDEESGWKCIEHYLKTEELPREGFSPDADFPVINCEKGIVYHTITVSADGRILAFSGGLRANMVPQEAGCTLRYDAAIEREAVKNGLYVFSDGKTLILKAAGVSAHGSHPEKGDNALIKLLKTLAPFFPELNEIYSAFENYGGEGVNLKISDEKSGFLTLNLGTASVKEGKIIFELDVRYPVSFTRDYITEALKKALKAEVTQGFYHDPLYVDPSHPLVQTLLSAYNDEFPEQAPATPVSIGGGTYARALPLGVAFGPAFPFSASTIHEKDEHIVLDEFYKMMNIYYRAIKKLCF